MSASKIFSGYRALGLVSTDVPLAMRYHKKHKENYVITAVGQSFHVYNCSKLGIVSVSDIHPSSIQVLSASQRHVFTGCANTIRCFDNGRKVIHEYQQGSDIKLLCPLGAHLIAIDSTGHLVVWDVHNEGIYLSLEFELSNFEPSAICHPHGYMNKVLLGSRQGSLKLLNVKHNRLVHSFCGWGEEILVLEQSPAVDVLAVGLTDGRIMLHNFRYDETIVKFTQDWGAVISVAFRTDGDPIMITGSASGHMAFWDLEKKCLKNQILEAHGKGVNGLQCFPQEPLMVSSSGDNTLKVWIFDLSDGGARLLRMREGHSAPPTFIRHYGDDGSKILTAGQDSTLRLFSTVHDKYNSSLGRASYNKSKSKRSGLKLDNHKMPPVTVFAAEPSRASDWENVVACHRGLRKVTTWTTHKSTMGRHKLDCKRFHHGQNRQTVAQAVDISPCGNFAAIGYSSGHVDVYNLQSGRHRGSFGHPVAHTGGVRGVAFNAYNEFLITAGVDCDLKFWRFGSRDKARILLKEVKLSAGIARIILHRHSNMLAIIQDDFSVPVLDLDMLRTVRVFSGHSAVISDVTFSADGRWLLTASLDCTVRVYSMVHHRLIDCFAVESAVTSITMSPTDDFLATSHVGDLGVYLWANRSLYSYLSLQPLPDNFSPLCTIQLPHTAHKPDDVECEEDGDVLDYQAAEFKSPEQISEELITLSTLPSSRWLSLLYLDIIKERSKPREPPRVPSSAPFFLPTVAGVQMQFAVQKDYGDKSQESSRVSVVSTHHIPSRFASLLMAAPFSNNYDAAMERLMSQGTFAIDADIRSLEGQELEAFLDFGLKVIHSKRNFDLINGYIGLFVKIHQEDIRNSTGLVGRLETMERSLHDSGFHLDTDMKQALCLTNYMLSAKLG